MFKNRNKYSPSQIELKTKKMYLKKKCKKEKEFNLNGI